MYFNGGGWLQLQIFMKKNNFSNEGLIYIQISMTLLEVYDLCLVSLIHVLFLLKN